MTSCGRTREAHKNTDSDTQQITLIQPAGRNYELHIPRGYQAGKALPLVVMLHGAGGSGENVLTDYGWAAKADEQNFIVAAPNALPAKLGKSPSLVGNPQFWDDGSNRGTQARGPIDDTGFISAVIDDVSRRYAIDAKRIYMAGHSNGASMTFHAGTPLCQRLAAIAPVMGQYWDNAQGSNCGLSMLYIGGSADPLNPPNGGDSNDPWGTITVKPPMRVSADKWAKQAGCSGANESSANGLATIRYNCAPNTEVLFQVINGQGHGWPGVTARLPQFILGPSVNTLNATNAIWAFFSRHTTQQKIQ
jgi:polyhydroxybutyrate depolymerase